MGVPIDPVGLAASYSCDQRLHGGQANGARIDRSAPRHLTDVPPTVTGAPFTMTWYPSPRAETSGVARPIAGNEPIGGSDEGSTVARYLVTAADCQLAFGDWLNIVENPPPEPNWSVAISSGDDAAGCT